MSRISRLCTSLLVLAMALLLSGAPADAGFIRCGCDFCRANPDVECQISPDGYSILCADYARINC